MRGGRLLLAAVAVAVAACGSTYGTESVARATLDDLVARHYVDVHSRFSPYAARVIPTQRIQLVWGEVLTSFGTYRSAGPPLRFTVSNNAGFDYPLRFTKGFAHLQITVDHLGRVTGIVVREGAPTGRFGV